MPLHPLNLDDFPDSVYANELRRGIGHLRFDAPLEAEYQLEHAHRVHRRVRIWYSLSFALAILFTTDQIRRGGIGSTLSWAYLCVLVPCSVILMWQSWSLEYERRYLPVERLLVPVFATCIAIFVAIAMKEGRDEQLASLTVALLGVFFFSGLMFRAALLTSVLMLIAFAGTAAAANLSGALLLKSMALLTLTNGIAAIVYHDAEQAYRRNFLKAALIRDLVTRDGLSRLMNRRAFDQHLPRVWQQALREQRSMAIVIIDIDHFKQYNDDFGHQAGDAALCRVAEVIDGIARRPLDLAARYGGDEFAVILFDLAYPHAQHVAERIREAVQNLGAVLRATDGAMSRKITVSVGVGLTTPTISRTPQDLLQLADEALYEAKRGGRNRVLVKGAEATVLLGTGSFHTPKKSRLRM